MSLWDQLYQMAKQYTQAQQSNPQPSSQNNNGNGKPQSQTPQSQTPSWAGGEGGAYAYQAPFGAQQGPSQGQQEEKKTQKVNEGNEEDESEEKGIWNNKEKRFNFNNILPGTESLYAEKEGMESLLKGVDQLSGKEELSNRLIRSLSPDEFSDLPPEYRVNSSWEPLGDQVGQEAEGKTDLTNGGLSESEFQKLFGLSRADYDKLEQRDQFQKALENSDLGKYYQDTYGIGGEYGYEQWRDLGETYDYENAKHDLVRDVLGLGEDPNMAIPGWLDLYGSVVNMDRGENNERDEQIIKDVMDYMWGEGNVINMADWMTDLSQGGTGYSSNKNLGAEGAADMIAQYYLNNYVGENALEGHPSGLDNKDLAAWAMAQNLSNKGSDYFGNFGQNNLNQIAAILGGAGDTASFAFANEGEDGSAWDRSNTGSNIADIILAAKQGNNLENSIYGSKEGEIGVNGPIFKNLVDKVMGDIEDKTGKKIKSSNRS